MGEDLSNIFAEDAANDSSSQVCMREMAKRFLFRSPRYSSPPDELAPAASAAPSAPSNYTDFLHLAARAPHSLVSVLPILICQAGVSDYESSASSMNDVGAKVAPELDEGEDDSNTTPPAGTRCFDESAAHDAPELEALPATDADFRQSGRFLCLDTGRRAADSDMELQTLGEEDDVKEGQDGAPASVGASDMAKMSHYMQSTQAAAIRAADAQARVQKFLADKTREPFVPLVLTKPKTPVVLRHSQQYVCARKQIAHTATRLFSLWLCPALLTHCSPFSSL